MSRLPARTAMRCAALSLLVLSAACSRPAPPDKEQPPEPQATHPLETHTELRDAIQAPIDRAKAVSPEVLEAAQKQRDDIDAQTNGGDATAPPPQ